MSNVNVNWNQVHTDLRGMGGWENDPNAPRQPSADYGAEPIANRPECWAWRPKVPAWLKNEVIEEPKPEHQDYIVYDGY